jgi:hypothetical protein
MGGNPALVQPLYVRPPDIRSACQGHKGAEKNSNVDMSEKFVKQNKL